MVGAKEEEEEATDESRSNLGEAVVEEDAEEAGSEADILLERALHGGPHQGLQLRAGIQVEVVVKATSRSHILITMRRRRRAADGDEQEA
jgi:hypothetical protein